MSNNIPTHIMHACHSCSVMHEYHACHITRDVIHVRNVYLVHCLLCHLSRQVRMSFMPCHHTSCHCFYIDPARTRSGFTAQHQIATWQPLVKAWLSLGTLYRNCCAKGLSIFDGDTHRVERLYITTLFQEPLTRFGRCKQKVPTP